MDEQKDTLDSDSILDNNLDNGENPDVLEEFQVEDSVKELKLPKKLKMKKSWRGKFISPVGIELTEVYCRRCIEYKNPKEFYRSFDPLDKSGMMSLCRSCCEEIYQNNLRSTQSVEKAMLDTCRTLNWVYFSSAITGANEKLKGYGNNGKATFTGVYWQICQSASGFGDKTSMGSKMTFTEPLISDYVPKEMINSEINQEIIDFWGEGYEESDYRILQKNYLEFKRDYKIDVKTEIMIAKELCFKILELEKARKNGGTEPILKSIQTLLKDAAWSPAMANMANSGKGLDTWGVRIATIQKQEPAEWLEGEEQRKKYLENYYGDLQYFKDFYVRSLKNYILGSKDYLVEGNMESQDDEEDLNVEELIIEEGKNGEEA